MGILEVMGEPAPGMSRQVCLGEGEGFLSSKFTLLNYLVILHL